MRFGKEFSFKAFIDTLKIKIRTVITGYYEDFAAAGVSPYCVFAQMVHQFCPNNTIFSRQGGLQPPQPPRPVR